MADANLRRLAGRLARLTVHLAQLQADTVDGSRITLTLTDNDQWPQIMTPTLPGRIIMTKMTLFMTKMTLFVAIDSRESWVVDVDQTFTPRY